MNLEDIKEYILQRFANKLYSKDHLFYIITTDGELYDLITYEDLLKENTSLSKPYIFIENSWLTYEPVFYYPFIVDRKILLSIYLQKHYYHRDRYDNLKYIVMVIHFSKTNETFMEVADIETIANNTGLQRLVQEILIEKDKNPNKNEGVITLELDFDEQGRLILTVKEDENEDEDEKVEELEREFETQSLFNGYNFQEAMEIINRYYNEKHEDLAEKVETIKNDYNRIFQPYRIVLSPNR